MGKNAFSGCSSLESVELQGTGITTMGAHCFDSCENLRKAALPARLEAIPYMCFANCIAIKQIKIPDTVKKIEADAFYGTAIKNVVIPENVEVVSANAFPQSWKCKSMTLSMACLGMQTRVEKMGIIRMPIDTTFYCLPGSAAQRFAQQYQYKCRPLSEALSDGRFYDDVNDEQETTARKAEQARLAAAMKNRLDQMR
jgi:hypothetical protein